MLWIPVGLACVALGTIGIIVPLLPSTVFFIAAAAAFSRSSARLEAWVLGLPKIGALVANYRRGAGMPRKAKVYALAMMWTAVLISIWRVDVMLARAVVAFLALVGTGVILHVPTMRPSDTHDSVRGLDHQPHSLESR